jgi:lysyl-tRNA synthetase class 2
VARSRGWRFAVVGVSQQNLERYERLGMRSLAMGDEAVILPAQFSLEGRAIRKVRQSVTRLGKAGYGFRVLPIEELDPALREQLDEVSAEWRGANVERGFSMAMDDIYAPGTSVALGEGPDGRIGGFLHLAPAPAGGGWSLSTMRRRRDTPNGLTEFLVVQTALWAKEQGASELSLNFCALTDFLDESRAVTLPRRLFRRALLVADNVFQLERLHTFSRKFHPVWRPRYVCVEKLTDLPLVGLAYLHLEQLLVPPGPLGALAAKPPTPGGKHRRLWRLGSRRERVSH